MRTLALPGTEGRIAPLGQLCFSPDGKNLALCATSSGKALVFDVASGQVRSSLGESSVTCFAFAFSPDSKALAFAVQAGEPGATRLLDGGTSLQSWDFTTGKLIRVIGTVAPMGPTIRAGKLAFAPTGEIMAFGGLDRVHLFDPNNGKELGQLEAEAGQFSDLAFLPDGKKLVANSASGKVLVWDMDQRLVAQTISRRVLFGAPMALAGDGKTLAVGTRIGVNAPSQAVLLWNIATNEEGITKDQGHEAAVHHLVFSADGKTLASVGDDQTLRWDMAGRERIAALPGFGSMHSFSRDGKLLAALEPRVGLAALRGSNWLQVWDTQSAKLLQSIELSESSAPQSVKLTPDGRMLVTLQSSHVFDALTGRIVLAETALRHWDVASGKPIRSRTMPALDGPLLPSADGKTVLGMLGRQLCIHDVESGRRRALGPESKTRTRLVETSPDMRLLALVKDRPDAGVPTMEVSLVEILTGKVTATLEHRDSRLGAIGWSPDGRIIATSDQHGNHRPTNKVAVIRVWDAFTGKKLAEFGGPTADITALAFAPDGNTLVAGLRDGSIYIFALDKVNLKTPLALKFSKDDWEACWADLIGTDAARAFRSIAAMMAMPQEAVAFLRDRVKPAELLDKKRIQKFIADLDSPTFAVRQAATKELQALGVKAEALIRTALKENVPLETHRRLEQILSALDDVPSAETVRTLRAILVLERVGSAEARGVLELLAKGEPGARETEEASGALTRMAERTNTNK